MSITTARLTRAAGLAAVVAGLLYVAVQPIHPTEEVATVSGTAWAVVGYMTMGFAVLGLVGLTAIYLCQVEEVGIPGLIGYLMFASFFLLATAMTFAETLILPQLASEAPQFVDAFLGIFSGAAGGVELGPLGAMGAVSFPLYLLGGTLFGTAVLQARVLSRPAAALFTFGALATLLVPVLPHAVGRYAALPLGLGLAWLGFSLWSEQGEAAAADSAETAGTNLGLATAE